MIETAHYWLVEGGMGIIQKIKDERDFVIAMREAEKEEQRKTAKNTSGAAG